MLQVVTVNGTSYENITFVRKWEDEGKHWLALRQKTREEIKEEQMQSTVDYVSMMTDIDLSEV